jgi:hypothetical protein
MTTSGPPPLEQLFRSRCLDAGFDIVHPFRVDAYNRSASSPLHDFGRRAALGLIVGNSRFLWDVLLAAFGKEPERLADEHPLDRYAMDRIASAAETFNAPYTIAWAHTPPPDAVPIQRIAHEVGFAWLSPSHLSIHPVFGPWLGFRAVIVVDEESHLPEPTAAPDPCTRCAKPCLRALENAAMASRTVDQASVDKHFELWRRVRDVCPEGAPYAYAEEQLRYHYTKERAPLLQLFGDVRAGAAHERS